MSLEVGNRRRVADLLTHHEVDLAIGGRPPSGAQTLATRANRLIVVAAAGCDGGGGGARAGGQARSAIEPPASAQSRTGSGSRSAKRRRRTAARAVIREELEGATWLLREPGSGTRATSEALFEELGIAPRILTFGSNGAVVESVRIGLGVTLISADAVAGDLAAGALEEWAHPGLPIERPWHLLARAGEPLAPTPDRFLTHLLGSGWDRPAAARRRRP